MHGTPYPLVNSVPRITQTNKSVLDFLCASTPSLIESKSCTYPLISGCVVFIIVFVELASHMARDLEIFTKGKLVLCALHGDTKLANVSVNV